MARKAAKTGAPPPATAPPAPVIEDVRQLVQLMIDHDLGEVDITDGDRKILLKRASAYPAAMPMLAPGALPGAAAPQEAPKEPAAAEEGLEIRSPMVGTFYSSASPESEPYVSVGSRVDEDTIICIVEAMKVMNEVKAECAGTVAQVCVRNAQPVEYGQVLYRVSPD